MRTAFVASLLALASLSVAPASAQPSSRIASYCSPSGDVCYGIFNNSGAISFQLTLAARYFSRYSICVRPPTRTGTCRSFPVRKTGSQFGGTVLWERNFPTRDKGRHRVTWKLAGRPLGPALFFRPPVPRV